MRFWLLVLGGCLWAWSARAGQLVQGAPRRDQFLEFVQRNYCGDWNLEPDACEKELCKRARQSDAEPGAISLWFADCRRRHEGPRSSIESALSMAAMFGDEKQRLAAYRQLSEIGVSRRIEDVRAINCGPMWSSGTPDCDSRLWACTIQEAACPGANACESGTTLYVSHTQKEPFLAALGEKQEAVLRIELSRTESCSCRHVCLPKAESGGEPGLRRCVRDCERRNACLLSETTCRLVYIDACSGRIGLHCRERQMGKEAVESTVELQMPR